MAVTQDAAAATQLLSLLSIDQERRPQDPSWVGGLKRQLLIEARVERGAISFVRMTIMRDRSKVLYPPQLSNNFQHRMPAGAG
jgi:hypothetical protein